MAKYVYKPFTVDAFEILKVRCICQHSTYELTLDNGTTIIADLKMCTKTVPIAGYYWIVEPDRYSYLLTKKAFKDKFEPIDELAEPEKITRLYKKQ